jgi:serine/threonine protein kinase
MEYCYQSTLAEYIETRRKNRRKFNLG